MRIGYGQYSPRQPADQQRQTLLNAGCRPIFLESKDDREQPELRACMKLLVDHARTRSAYEPSTLVICSLDRLASSIDGLSKIVDELVSEGIVLHSLRDEVRGPTADQLAEVLRLIGNFRRENIADKTQRGVLVAEERGLQTGRPPKLSEEQLRQALSELAKGKPVGEVAAAAGISVQTLYRYRTAHARKR